MDSIGSILLSPWLSKEDRGRVCSHSKENFTYVRYQDIAKPITKNCISTYEERIGRLNKVTREVMWNDPPPIVGFKQFLLTICHIPYTAGHLLTHPIKCIYHVANDLFALRLWECMQEIAYRMSAMVRTLYYMSGMFVALILGVFIDPIKAREAYGLLDFHHNGDVEYSHSFTRLTEKQVPCWEAANKTEACYFAKCMQPWIHNFDEMIALDGFLYRRYHVVQQTDKVEEINFWKG